MNIKYIILTLIILGLVVYFLIKFLDPQRRSKKLSSIAHKYNLSFVENDSSGNMNIITGKIGSNAIFFCDKQEVMAIEKLYNVVGKKYVKPWGWTKEETLDLKSPMSSKERISKLSIGDKSKMIGAMFGVREGMPNFSNTCMSTRDLEIIFEELDKTNNSPTFESLKTGRAGGFYLLKVPYVREDENNFLS